MTPPVAPATASRPAPAALPPLIILGASVRALAQSAVLFTSGAALENGIGARLGLTRPLLAVGNTRGGISKKDMVHNTYLPKIEVNAETYEVRADGQLLVCEPAQSLPMAQRYFLF